MQQSPTASVRHCFPSARRFFYGFFDLRSPIAGEIVQKFAMYGKRVAIVGDIAERTATSGSLAAFVTEANRGRDLWFVESPQELTAAVHGR
jgi:Domain of unknown function (DUF4180)